MYVIKILFFDQLSMYHKIYEQFEWNLFILVRHLLENAYKLHGPGSIRVKITTP